MSLLMYSSGTNSGNSLQELMESAFPQEKLEVCRSTGELVLRLRQWINGIAVVVLFIKNQKELQDLLAFHDLLTDFRLILILPDRNKDTIKRAHGLRPRFLTFSDGNMNDVTAVLQRMLLGSGVREIMR